MKPFGSGLRCGGMAATKAVLAAGAGGGQPTMPVVQKDDSTTLFTPSSDHPYPAVAPMYQPVQFNTGPIGIAGAFSKSAASAGPANSSAAPAKPRTFLIRPSHYSIPHAQLGSPSRPHDISVT